MSFFLRRIVEKGEILQLRLCEAIIWLKLEWVFPLLVEILDVVYFALLFRGRSHARIAVQSSLSKEVLKEKSHGILVLIAERETMFDEVSETFSLGFQFLLQLLYYHILVFYFLIQKLYILNHYVSWTFHYLCRFCYFYFKSVIRFYLVL